MSSLSAPVLPVEAPPRTHARRTPLFARGEPAVWMMGAALVVCCTMIAGLLAIIVVQGMNAFWPRPIELAVLRSGERLMGMPIRDEPFEPTPAQREQIERLKAQGSLWQGAIADDGRPIRRQYRVGNRELGQQPFRWANLFELTEAPSRPLDAVLLERQEWGVWIGTPERVVRMDQKAGAEPRTLADGPVESIRYMREARSELRTRGAEILALRRDTIGDLNARMESWRTRVRAAELELLEQSSPEAAGSASDVAQGGRGPAMGAGPVVWVVTLVLAIASGAALIVCARRLFRVRIAHSRRLGLRLACAALACVCALSLAFAALERPRAIVDAASVAALRERAAAEVEELKRQSSEVLTRIASLEREQSEVRVVVRDAAGVRFAPSSQTAPNDPLPLANVVRCIAPNQLGFFGKAGAYLDRWREFLAGEPRASNTEGGVFPVVLGTVLLTLLLSVTVVPLGVIAALYLREYAAQGIVTSAVRIAVNNLAGVPSIVYGVFGLGFFCYTIGPYIDAGPDAPLPAPRWWAMLLAGVVIVFGALAMGVLARPHPGRPAGSARRWLKRSAAILWIASCVLVVVLLATTPYFHGFFRAELASAPTFGTRGLLWAALTLALLTLPVVIVATEEAIAAVPRSMREGSFGCGASHWQTIRRIVLPGAMPGVLTGMILAMARGAGEVAPLMIVGAVKTVDGLPISSRFPFIHLDRTFMHLGFHIFDLGFQSPDAEAARALVWTTTLLLIAIVVLLNLSAIIVRTRLRRRLAAGHF